MIRIKLTPKETTKNWLNVLHELKYLIDNTEVSEISSYLMGKSISRSWSTFLQTKKIIYIENGIYKWNDKIPVSHKLIERFREYVNKKNRKYIIDKNTKYNKQEPNLFDMPQTPLPKPPKFRKTRTPKVEVQFYDEPKSELGVIRKFFKWLW